MMRKRILLFTLVPLSLFLLSFVVLNDQLFEVSKHLDIFTTLYKELSIFYVDEVDDEKLTRKAIDAMLNSLDPYTEYFPETELEDYKMSYISTEYGGVGALIQTRDGKVIISEPYEGFPAQKNDIRAGDELLEVDGRSVKEFPVDKVSEKLKGKPGTKLKVVIVREGEEKPIEKNLIRDEIKFGNIQYAGIINNGIGYIKLDKFLSNCYAEFRNSFQDLKKKGANKLIIDLRGNGGGILQEAVQIINLFVPKGETIVTQKGKIAEMNSNYTASNEPLDNKIPIVVLVDTASASASEITAGALQDIDRGVIIGQRTFGKGLVQQTKQLAYNSQLKITVAKYYTPSGRCVQAINYSKKDKKGKSNYIPDSLIVEYKTKNGRSVYDGSGISPDIKTEIPSYSSLLLNLVSKYILFDYATQYRLKNPEIVSAKEFKLNDKEYNEFCSFALAHKFEYQTGSMEKFKELMRAAEEEKYFETSKDAFTQLEKMVAPDKEKDLKKYKSEIKEFLENEIVSRYYFQNGRLENMLFNYDVEIQKAVQVLTNTSLYTSILKGEGEYKFIGKPTAKN
jgi:carboxyl-terminal processing protease